MNKTNSLFIIVLVIKLITCNKFNFYFVDFKKSTISNLLVLFAKAKLIGV